MPLPTYSHEFSRTLSPVDRKAYAAIHFACKKLVRDYCLVRREVEHITNGHGFYHVEVGASEADCRDECRERLRAQLERFGISLDSQLVREELQRIQDALPI